MDYYTKTAFEFVSYELGSQSAIAGGGRYDLLIEELGGRSTSAIGFAIGIERAMELVNMKEDKNKSIYVGCSEEYLLDNITTVSMVLRRKYKVDFSYDLKGINPHFKKALKSKVKWFLFIGEDEKKNNQILIKNLQDNKEELINIDKIGSYEFI